MVYFYFICYSIFSFQAQMVRRVKAYLNNMNIISDEDRLHAMSTECEPPAHAAVTASAAAAHAAQAAHAAAAAQAAAAAVSNASSAGGNQQSVSLLKL
jgi:Rap guanine nucleotide exchange factor 2